MTHGDGPDNSSSTAYSSTGASTTASTSATAILATGALLIALLALTVGAAFLPLGPWGPALAMTIASAKAALVAIVFMHLRRASHLARIFALVGVIWWLIFLAGVLTDYLTRGG